MIGNYAMDLVRDTERWYLQSYTKDEKSILIFKSRFINEFKRYGKSKHIFVHDLETSYFSWLWVPVTWLLSCLTATCPMVYFVKLIEITFHFKFIAREAVFTAPKTVYNGDVFLYYTCRYSGMALGLRSPRPDHGFLSQELIDATVICSTDVFYSKEKIRWYHDYIGRSYTLLSEFQRLFDKARTYSIQTSLHIPMIILLLYSVQFPRRFNYLIFFLIL